MVHMADSKKQLDSDTESILSVARKHFMSDGNLEMAASGWTQYGTALWHPQDQCPSYPDHRVYRSADPLPYSGDHAAGRYYYGQNAVSKNMLVADRRKLLNGNSFRLGVSGSGKSFSAKEEIVDLALSTEDDILILDPESEFGSLVEALNGEVISISARPIPI